MTDVGANARTVAALLEFRAAQTPTTAAFHQQSADHHWEPTNWQEFARRVAKLRRALRAAGLRKGDRLALVASVSLEWELLHHAALAMGAVVVGLDAHDLPERIADMAEQADIAAFATSDWHAVSALRADRLAGARFVLYLGGNGGLPAGGRTLTWLQLEALGDAPEADPDQPTAEDVATIVFTSGTTGAPKGIAYTHGQVCLAIDAISDAFDFVGSDGRLLCWLPLSNLFQRMVNLVGIRRGATTYLLSDPRRVMQVVATVSPDIFVGVPRFYEKLHEGIRDNIAAAPPLRRRLVEWAWDIGRRASQYRLAGRKLPAPLALTHWVADGTVLKRVRGVMGQRLRCMISGSAPTPLHLLEEFHALGWLVLEAYGLSENVLPMAMNRTDDFRFGTVGRPLPGNQIEVTADGAITVRGPSMLKGYLGEEDRPPFDSDGFYRTGDLGQFDADGYLRLTGRIGDLIKTSTGRHIAPAGVEASLRRVPGIDQAILIGAGRKCLVALCSCAGGSLCADDQALLGMALREEVGRIGEHERPAGIALIAGPLSIERGEITPNLKLRRGSIEARYAELIERLYERIDEDTAAAAQGLVIL